MARTGDCLCMQQCACEVFINKFKFYNRGIKFRLIRIRTDREIMTTITTNYMFYNELNSKILLYTRKQEDEEYKEDQTNYSTARYYYFIYYADSILRDVDESVFKLVAGEPLSCACLPDKELDVAVGPLSPLAGGITADTDDAGMPGLFSTTTAVGP